jgi:hypothetical protein
VTAQPPHRSTGHVSDDRLLVVRDAAGEPLDPSERARLEQLLASSPEVRELRAELELIARATADAAVPARVRDLRLTPADAARLRPSRLTRFLGRFAMPGGGALRPLASATLTVGLVLAAAGTMIPSLGSDSGTGGAESFRAATSAAAADRSDRNAAEGAITRQGGPATEDVRSPGTEQGPEVGETQVFLAASPAPSATADHGETLVIADVAARSGPWSALVVVGLLLAVVGTGALALSVLVARRTGDPLLH